MTDHAGGDQEAWRGDVHPGRNPASPLAPRYSIPFDDVKSECLTPSATRGICPYKGRQAYYTVHGGDATVDDGAWAVSEPFGEAIAVAGHVSFRGEGTDVYADGQSTPI